GANRSWVSETNAGTTLTVRGTCPPSDTWTGLDTYDTLSAARDTWAGEYGEWRLNTPPDLRIRAARIYRYLGKEASTNWTVYGRADGATFDTCNFDPNTEVRCSTGFPAFNSGAA